MQVFTESEALEQIKKRCDENKYYAMYSSWMGGIVKDQHLMFVPADEHMVHRGDGVFEAFKFQHGAFYDMQSHLDRLRRSAEMIQIDIRWSDEQIIKICQNLIEVGDCSEAVMRLYVSRGPGDFTPNPYTTIGPQLYIIATELKRPDAVLYSQGTKLIKSDISVKPDFFSRVKSCNYLSNVLMKKWCIDNECNFSVNYTVNGELCEGATENILVLTKENELIAPPFGYTLQGTTLQVVLELAEANSKELGLVEVGQRKLSEEELVNAKEVMMVGTTLEVMPVTRYNDKSVGSGKVGEFSKRVRELLQLDMKNNPLRRIVL